jgi:hypothetical protein
MSRASYAAKSEDAFAHLLNRLLHEGPLLAGQSAETNFILRSISMTRLLTLTGLSLAIALAATTPLSAQESSSRDSVNQPTSTQGTSDAPSSDSAYFPEAPAPQYNQTVEPPVRDNRTYNHVELGAYGEYIRIPTSSGGTANYLGLGGRVGINTAAHVALEAEMDYDFERNYTTTYSTTTGGTVTTATVVSKVRPLMGLFGPKLQFGSSGPFRAFIEGKVGFVDITESNNAPSGSTFTTAVSGVGGAGTHLAAFPGGGIEFFAGPLGLRADAGDEIFINNGTTNNLRVTFGPAIRF